MSQVKAQSQGEEGTEQERLLMPAVKEDTIKQLGLTLIKTTETIKVPLALATFKQNA